ncbi:MAG TPA: hypothetical protein VFA61_08725 [Candidatus Udaeobacter sp.]|nr:hypothetical protein [Candidatus Udaeobacter sp.]
MAQKIKKLLEALEEDSFRKASPFSNEVEKTASALFGASKDEELADILGKWLSQYQPCLFGKIAAKLGGLSYCFLSERDLNESDEHVRQKIQSARHDWRRKAFDGDASGFVILAMSEKLSKAVPDDTVKTIARRLCHLYLGRDDMDEILLEDVFLRVPGKQDAVIHWRAGVNYFSAHGDKRWWNDHRIPGGIGFSMNSVGHMVKSYELGRSAEEMWKKLGLPEEGWPDFKVNSLGVALKLAMQTINSASEAISGKATHLLPLDRVGANPRGLKCPITLPGNLQNKDFCEYFGYYHTDITMPSEYFRQEVERPDEIVGHDLDFTYLFDSDVENPAFEELGTGVRIQADLDLAERVQKAKSQKIQRMFGAEGRITDYPVLKETLGEI